MNVNERFVISQNVTGVAVVTIDLLFVVINFSELEVESDATFDARLTKAIQRQTLEADLQSRAVFSPH